MTGKTTGHYVEGLLAYDCIDGEWRIRWHGPQRAPYLDAPLLECPRYIKLQAMTAWDTFVASVVEMAEKYAKGEVGR